MQREQGIDVQEQGKRILKTIRRQLGVARRVLDVPMPEPCLQRSGVAAGVGKREAAAVVQRTEGYAGRDRRTASEP